MPDEIQPALTPREWNLVRGDANAERPKFDGQASARLRLISMIEDDPCAIMALMNHFVPDNDPRKITREDVLNLRDLADIDLEFAAKDIAAKLAALLPPE